MHYAKTEQCERFYSQMAPSASLDSVREDGHGVARKRHCGTQDFGGPNQEDANTEEVPVAAEDEEQDLVFFDPLFEDHTRNQNAFEDDTLAYSTDQQYLVDLMKILSDMNAPDYAFCQLLTWACKSHGDGFSFQPEWGCSRNSNIRWMFQMTSTAKLRLPYVVPVPLEDNQVAEIVAFDFVSALLTLLQDRSVMKKENLVLDWEDPLKMYTPPDGCLGEALSGSVYRNMYETYITDPSKQLLFPLIDWSDRSECADNNRFSLAPVMFTGGIFTEKFRRTMAAWGVMGYMPDLKLSSAERAKMSKGEVNRGYHTKLSAIMSSYVNAGDRLKKVPLPIGPTGSMNVDLVVVYLDGIQDIEEGDKRCGRFKGHNQGIKRHCRACDVGFEDMDDPYVQCRYVTAAEIRAVATSNNPALEKAYSTHHHDNAFDRVPMGDPVRGIHGSTPSEPMHCVRKGVIERVAKLLLDNVPQGKKKRLDALATQFHRSHRQTYRANYPSTNFGKGVTNLTKISAGEYVGILFLFVILAHYDEGWQILDSSIQRRGHSNLTEVLELLEALLCFDAWLKKTTQWHLSREAEAMDAAKASIRVLMSMCIERLPRNKGNGWRIPKFHELLHIVDDMSRFGAAPNFMAERAEALLKDTVKKPGRRAQKRHHGIVFEQQSARRLAETAMVNALHQRIGQPDLYNNSPDMREDEDQDRSVGEDELSLDDEVSSDDEGSDLEEAVEEQTKIFESTGRGTFGTVRTNLVGGQPHVRLSWRTKSAVDTMGLPVPLLAYIYTEFGPEVSIYTEYRREDLIFRCHPNYQNGGPIFDWMRIRFQQEGDSDSDDDSDDDNETGGNNWKCYPSRLACVVVKETADTDGVTSEEYELVVQCATKKTGIKSALFTEWEWSPDYYRVETDSVDSPCFVVSMKGDNSLILETLALDKWGDEFTPNFDTPKEN